MNFSIKDIMIKWGNKAKQCSVVVGSNRRRVIVVFVTGAALCVAITVFLLYDYYRVDFKTARVLEEFRLEGEAVRAKSLETSTGDGNDTEMPSVSQTLLTENPYASAFQRNPDIQGWLRVEGTQIDYPVLQREGDDEYYLYRSFLGEEDKKGSLILDEDSSVKDGSFTTNLLIHGHNMKDGSMFGELDEYNSEDFYKEHKWIELYTEDEKHNYEVIAAFASQIYYSTDLVFKYYNFFQADTAEEFNYFYQNIKRLSIYDTGVTAEFGDKFLTLSTCAYHVEDGRFVVVAKEIDPGEK